MAFFFHFSLGAVALDSPNSTAPVSSVSLLPPPPQPKNTARMLALALAESAQQATILSQREVSEPPTPISPEEFLETLDLPPTQSLKPQTSQEETAHVPQFPAPSSSFASCTPNEALTQSTSMHLFVDDGEKSPNMSVNKEDNVTLVAPSKGASSQHVQLSPTYNSSERQQPSVGSTPISTETCSTTTATNTSTISRKELIVTPQPSSKVRFKMPVVT